MYMLLCVLVRCIHNVFILQKQFITEFVSAAEALIDVNSLPKTRSGRRVYPVMEHFRGQRLVRNDHLGTLWIENGSPSQLLGGGEVKVFKSDAVSKTVGWGAGEARCFCASCSYKVPKLCQCLLLTQSVRGALMAD